MDLKHQYSTQLLHYQHLKANMSLKENLKFFEVIIRNARITFTSASWVFSNLEVASADETLDLEG